MLTILLILSEIGFASNAQVSVSPQGIMSSAAILQYVATILGSGSGQMGCVDHIWKRHSPNVEVFSIRYDMPMQIRRSRSMLALKAGTTTALISMSLGGT